MERVNRILAHRDFVEVMQGLNDAEKDRIYCKHDLEHLLNVARIMTIRNLEKNLGISKDIIYGTALLHDIGRLAQYETGQKHAQVGCGMAAIILKACGYKEVEIVDMCEAINGHSESNDFQENTTTLNSLLKESDKLSRNCFLCTAKDTCYWGEKGKVHNGGIQV